MIETEAFDLMKRDEHLDEKLLVLVLQRQSKSIDYTAVGKKGQEQTPLMAPERGSSGWKSASLQESRLGQQTQLGKDVKRPDLARV